MSSHDSPESSTQPALWQCRVWMPGVLTTTIQTRMRELESGALTRFMVELISFDLRGRVPHSLTAPIARKGPAIQQAVDRAIASHYHPGSESYRARMEGIVRNGFGALPAMEPCPLLSKTRHTVYLRRLHREIIEERIESLQFANVSEYITSLIRYDLLLGGRHLYFHGDDCTPEMAEALDRETLQTYRENRQRKVMIDYVVEEVIGRPLTAEERAAELGKVSERLCEQAIAAARRSPSRGP